MKTKYSILSACGLASAILTVGLPATFAQDEYELADPPSGSTQQGRSFQQQGTASQQQPQEQQWQQQRPQGTQNQQSRQQQQSQGMQDRQDRQQQQAWQQDQQGRQQDQQAWQQDQQGRQQDQQAWQQDRQGQQQERQTTRAEQQTWTQQQRSQQQAQQSQRMQQQAQQQLQYTRLIAAIRGVDNQEDVKGTVQFDRESQGARVVVEIGGLQDEQLYSIRIHQFGDFGSFDGQSVGDSFNPGMDLQQQTIATQQPRTQTGTGIHSRTETRRNLGDLGSVRSDSNGNIRVERTVTGLQLSSGESGILGRSVVVHRADDDTRHNPVGVGVIGISKDGLPGGQMQTTTSSQRGSERYRDSD
jgi:Cu/Zn superoxide dismutase